MACNRLVTRLIKGSVSEQVFTVSPDMVRSALGDVRTKPAGRHSFLSQSVKAVANGKPPPDESPAIKILVSSFL
jgi:hypothetical protein